MKLRDIFTSARRKIFNKILNLEPVCRKKRKILVSLYDVEVEEEEEEEKDIEKENWYR